MRRSGERHGEAAQTADHRRGIGVDHEQGQDERLELQSGRHQDAGHRGQRGSDRPAQGGEPGRAPAEGPDQAAVVDHPPHGDAGAGPVEEEAQPDRDGDGGTDRDDLLPVDVHAEEREAVEAEELGHDPRRRLPEVVVDQAEEEQGQPHGDRQRRGHVVGVHPLDHGPLDHRPEQGGEHEDGQDEGQRGVEVPAHGELPVDEGHEHAHGPVGDVEDARGGVGDDEAAGRHGVGRAEDDADDGELEELVHRRAS